ncbi:SurA N-terminal domain-containing protein [Neisseria iguanae]|uniref:Peptidylprolyl isomerase n=1 Tax=Neisseria iguanae TaxID=90242 RepID=A0A2P7TXV1_9NEIS|nr:SurA N-terminal domain-containing protein [Neisseria iguanae]PSJ79525.1 peptidylprolyl isomerase [Neisseria iguanae]
MFHSVEKYKLPAQILLGLIALTFVGFGVSTVAAPGSDYIVKIGDQKVSDHILNAAMQNAQAAGGNESREAVFQSLLQRAYLTQGAKMMGIAVSQEQIKQIIVDDPSFHDADGKFSQAKLTQYLGQRRMSEDQFVEEIREQFALQNLLNLVQNGTIVSDAQAVQLVNLIQAARTVRSVTFSPEVFASQVKADDQAVQSFYDANKKDYVVPQAVKIEYVALDANQLAAGQKVSEEEVRKAFDEQAAAAPTDNKPVFEQEKASIETELKLKKVAGEFNKLKEQLAEEVFNNPNSLTEAAKKLNLKVEEPDEWLTRANGKAAGMPDELITAIFSEDVLQKRHNSEPVTIAPDVVWVVRAKDVREEKTAPFDEVKEEVRSAYLLAEARKLAEKKADEALADLKSGQKTTVEWSQVSDLNAQQARQSMPPGAYAELLKARPAAGKPAYVKLEGLPAPVILEVQAIKPPENVNEQLPAAKQAVVQQQTANVFDQLLQYLNKKIKHEQGAQKVNPTE